MTSTTETALTGVYSVIVPGAHLMQLARSTRCELRAIEQAFRRPRSSSEENEITIDGPQPSWSAGFSRS